MAQRKRLVAAGAVVGIGVAAVAVGGITLGPPGGDPSPAECDAGAGTWNADRGAKWILGNYGNTLYNHALPPNPPGAWDCMDVRQQKGRLAARSGHPGGVSVLFCDGGVRFVADGTPADVWQALATRAGREAVATP